MPTVLLLLRLLLLCDGLFACCCSPVLLLSLLLRCPRVVSCYGAGHAVLLCMFVPTLHAYPLVVVAASPLFPLISSTSVRAHFTLLRAHLLSAVASPPFPQGRQLLWGWIQEHRRVSPPPCECPDFTYAGCVSSPRCLFLREGRLYQTPLPELVLLRSR